MCCERKGRVPEIAVAVGSVMSPRTARGGVSGGVRALVAPRVLVELCARDPVGASVEPAHVEVGFGPVGDR